MSILPNTIKIHNTSYQYQSKPRNMHYPISDTAILTNYSSSFCFNCFFFYSLFQLFHDQPRPSPYTTASRSTSSTTTHNGFTIVLV
ncbi:hypothetical protein ACLKA6_012211 [Drosophila palustris]